MVVIAEACPPPDTGRGRGPQDTSSAKRDEVDCGRGRSERSERSPPQSLSSSRCKYKPQSTLISPVGPVYHTAVLKGKLKSYWNEQLEWLAASRVTATPSFVMISLRRVLAFFLMPDSCPRRHVSGRFPVVAALKRNSHSR